MNCKKEKQIIAKAISTKAFIHTEDQSPRDSQDDKSFSKHFEIIHFYKYPVEYSKMK